MKWHLNPRYNVYINEKYVILKNITGQVLS